MLTISSSQILMDHLMFGVNEETNVGRGGNLFALAHHRLR